MVILSPLGLLIPGYFNSKTAWGEWGIEEVRRFIGYAPKGLESLSTLWKAPIPDYAIKGWEEKGLSRLSFAYIISAAAGVIIVAGLVLFIGRILTKKGD